MRNEWAIGAMTLKDNVSRDRAQEIAQEYAELIKESSTEAYNIIYLYKAENNIEDNILYYEEA